MGLGCRRIRGFALGSAQGTPTTTTPEDEVRTDAQRHAIHRVLTMHGDVERFLCANGRTLSDAAIATLLDALEGELLPALALTRTPVLR
jgi:hypothetical protein